MLIREVRLEEKEAYNKAVNHPLQSWEWGEFKKQTGTTVERVGFYSEGKLVKGLQVSFHPIPVLNQNVGYFPKGYMPDADQLKVLQQMGERNNSLFIKMEPNIAEKVDVQSGHDTIARFLIDHQAVPGRPLFTKYTFQIDLTQSEEKLFANLKSKTRYNVNLAIKKGVKIYENTTQEGMEEYLAILAETTSRQGFYAHTPDYFRTMWNVLGQSGMIRIFQAVYQDTIVVSWVVFMFNGVLYYPYGASRSVYRDVMASNLMLWEMIRFGKENGCHMFDLWGSLGPNPDSKHAWYGFHKFKEGYGGDLVQFLGTYDLVLNFPLYKLFRIAEDIRWKALRFRAKLPF